MRLVELCGLPGSGKSTLAKAISKHAQSGSVNVTSRLPTSEVWPAATPRFVRNRPERDILFKATQFRLKHPDFFRMVDEATAQDATTNFLFGLTGATCETVVSANEENGAYLLDEGFVYRASALCFTRGLDPRTWAEKSPLPDVLIVADVSPDVAHARVVARRSGRASRFGDVESFAERRRLMTSMVAGVEARGVPVITVNSTQPVAAAVESVVTELVDVL